MSTGINWDAAEYFERLIKCNKLAKENGFRFATVSSLDGFHESISSALTTTALVAVSDTSSGAMVVSGSPYTRRIKTVFLFMRHAVGDSKSRARAMATLEELFRQFMSALILEKTRLAEDHLYIDDRISFTEVDKYFYTGGACAFFQIAVDTMTDISYNSDEWLS